VDIGQSLEKKAWSEFHRQSPRMSVAVGAAVRRENRILFVRQMYGWMRGLWGLPTGFVDQGERPDAAALREVREEAGIVAALDGLLSVTLVDWEGDPQMYMAFLCRHLEGELIADGKENDRAAYFSLVEMDAFGEPFEPLCERIARSVLRGECQVLRRQDTASLDARYLTMFA
jgi:ADP-ribose pyrophosphatase YjhB (NUDIX family)